MSTAWTTLLAAVAGAVVGGAGTLLGTLSEQRFRRRERVSEALRADAARIGARLAVLVDLIDAADPDVYVPATYASRDAKRKAYEHLYGRFLDATGVLREASLMHPVQEVREQADAAASAVRAAVEDLGRAHAAGPALEGNVKAAAVSRDQALTTRSGARASVLALADLVRNTGGR